jgi:hypothetical protein
MGAAVTELGKLKAAEVSLVPRGANRKVFFLTKEDKEGAWLDEILKAILETDLHNEAQVDAAIKKAGIGDKPAAALKSALRLLNAYKDTLPKDVLKMAAELTGLDTPPAPQVTAQVVALKADGTPDWDTVPKEVRPALQALWKTGEDNRVRAEAAEKVAKEERDARVLKEYQDKAATYTHLGINATTFGGVLKEIGDKAPTALPTIEATLKAADEAVAKGNLFKEQGSSLPGGTGEAMGKVDALAKEKCKDGKVTKEMAVAEVLKEHPELYTAYLSETKGGK